MSNSVPQNSSGLSDNEKATILVDLQSTPVDVLPLLNEPTSLPIPVPVVNSSPILDLPTHLHVPEVVHIPDHPSSTALILSQQDDDANRLILPVDNRLPLLPFRDDGLFGIVGSLLFDKPPDALSLWILTPLIRSFQSRNSCRPTQLLWPISIHLCNVGSSCILPNNVGQGKITSPCLRLCVCSLNLAFKFQIHE